MIFGSLAILLGALLSILAFGFWIWMLVDCLQNNKLQGNNKLVWVVVVVFLHFLGALLYFLIERPKYA